MAQSNEKREKSVHWLLNSKVKTFETEVTSYKDQVKELESKNITLAAKYRVNAQNLSGAYSQIVSMEGEVEDLRAQNATISAQLVDITRLVPSPPAHTMERVHVVALRSRT